MPKISVIISTHNRKDKLKRAIDSVLNQSFQDFEIIVSDDKSLDGTRELIKEMQGNDSRLKYTRLSCNFGNHSKPKNEGIKISTGEYIAFLDDDNSYRPDHLQILYKEMERDSSIDVVYGDRMIVKDGKNMGIGVFSDFDPFLLLRKNYIDTSDSLIKREAIEYIGGFDESHKRMLDWNLYVRLAKSGYRFKRVNQIITDYEIHDGQLSNEKEDKMFDPIDCKIVLPYLGKELLDPKVAVFSITYNRLEYSKKCFQSLLDTAGYSFDHFIIDNGSTDGTEKWLDEYPCKFFRLNGDNRGISIASNQALEAIGDGYDIIIKIDNDCLFKNKGWMSKMVELWKSNHMMALSCYVQGLRDNPGGAPRMDYGMINGEVIGLTHHIGGICCFASSKAYDNFRWDEYSTLHGVQDLEFSQHLLKNGYGMGYLENWYCEHIDGTDGQEDKYPDYFKNRKIEKTTSYKQRKERTYKQIQEQESAFSRDTIWGERIKDSILKYKDYINGKVLDIGCGDGYGLDILRENGFESEGIDISAEKITIAQNNGHKARLGVMEKLPFKDKEFDTIFCSHTLEHSSYIEKACNEIKRVGKRAIIIVPIEENTQNPGHTSQINSPEYLKSFFSDCSIIHEEELQRLEKEYVLIIDL